MLDLFIDYFTHIFTTETSLLSSSELSALILLFSFIGIFFFWTFIVYIVFSFIRWIVGGFYYD